MKINYNVTGAQRKELTQAIGEVIGQVPVYAGMPTAAYHMVGGYTVSKTGEFTAEGSATDETNAKIIARLEELGYTGTLEDNGGEEAAQESAAEIAEQIMEAAALEDDGCTGESTIVGETTAIEGGAEENTATVETPAAKTDTAKPDKISLPRLYTLDTPRGEIFIAEEFTTHDEAAAEGYGEYFSTALGTVYSYNDDRTFALVTSKKAGDWDTTKIKRDFREATTVETENGTFTVEMPLTGFTPEKLDNLSKLVNAKAPILKTALGAEDLPIQQTEDRLRFPWFWSERILTNEEVTAYTTLVSLLCKTAKEKKRVTAKEKETENPKYAMRCFLLSLGFIGDEYKVSRRILLSKLEGNSSWKNGKPEPVVENTESEVTDGE